MEWKYEDLTRKIIGAVMKVHSSLENGFPEIIYQRAMCLQLKQDSVLFQAECTLPVFYLDQKIGDRRVDFLVDNKICVERKAVSELDSAHFAQAGNYLEAFNLGIGLRINVGKVSLQYKRLNNPKFNPSFPNLSNH